MPSKNNTPNVLVFSIALNGYQALYRKNFISHHAYADRCGYCYQCVLKPTITPLGMECAWLKVTLIIQALRGGYDWVMFLDADTQVNPTTPALSTLDMPYKNLYVVKGYSGRLNSGVLIVKNSTAVIRYFEQALRQATMPLPTEDDVGWGENGHLIHFAKYQPFVHYLDPRWNNNTDPALGDYIRHYSCGPLYNLYHATLSDRVRYWLTHYYLALYKRGYGFWHSLRKRGNRSFHCQLNSLTNQVLQTYPQFFHGNDHASTQLSSSQPPQSAHTPTPGQSKPACCQPARR